MASPADVVAEQFSMSRTTAGDMITQAETFIGSFTDALFPAALVDVTFAPLTGPSAVSIPAAPAFPDAPTWDIGSAPADPVIAAPDITVDDFTVVAPTLTFPDAPVLDFGVAPVITIGDAPTVDAIAVITVPDAPIVDAVSVPALLSLTTPAFAGIDLHADYLANLTTIPTLEMVAPTPFSYAPGPTYASSLLDALRATLLARMAGGTGLNPTVEAAIWDRARSREAQIGASNEADVARTNEALGFQLPTGALAAQLRQAQQDTANKVSGLSRDVAIKQADLEQANLKDSIAAGMELEGKLIDYSFKLEQEAFDIARTYAENAVQVYNAQVEKFKTVLQAYQLYAQVFDTLIKEEQLKVDVYRAEIAGEQAKADANRTLIEQYRAQIEAGLTQVKIFEAQVGAARARMELEQAKLAAQGEQIKAYVAGINGQTAKLEAYKIGVEAQGTRAQVYKIGVDAQTSVADAFRSQAQAFAAKAGAQAEKARANVSYYTAQGDVFRAKVGAYAARAEGESSRFRAIAAQAGILLDSYKAETQTLLATVDQDIKRWEIGIKEYEATQTFAFNATKANNDVLQARGQMLLDATKAGAQILAQLASSALSTAHVSAQVGASATNQVSYSYGNDTTGPAPSVTAV